MDVSLEDKKEIAPDFVVDVSRIQPFLFYQRGSFIRWPLKAT